MQKNELDYINLSEKDMTVKVLRVAAGWDLKEFDGENIDVDLSCFILGSDGKTREDGDFVFYNNLKSPDLAVRHLGDNRDGMGETDDEAIIIDIGALAYNVYKIVFVASIYFADDRNQDFTHVDNAYVRVVNETTDEELARDDMEEKFERATAVKFCELERVGSEWHFRKLHKPLEKGLREAAESYGCIISSIG
tara:strand:+ start:429 stop:1010 length:582 start_codon:yes stop_codon:yes gene_type:complete